MFSEVVTGLLCNGVDLSNLGEKTGVQLTCHATKSRTKPTSVDYHCCEPLGTERVLLNLAKGVFKILQSTNSDLCSGPREKLRIIIVGFHPM